MIGLISFIISIIVLIFGGLWAALITFVVLSIVGNALFAASRVPKQHGS